MNVRNEVQAVIFDKNDGKLVLLVQKRDRRVRHFRWRLLKGGINLGENRLEALRREIFEETGLKNIEILDRIHGYEFVFKGTRHSVSTYLVKADSREPIRIQESELSDYAWTEPENALRLLYWHNEKEALMKMSQFSQPV